MGVLLCPRMTPAAKDVAIVVVDVRGIAPRDRRAPILAAFRALAEGQTLHVVSDAVLEPLYFEFQVEMPRRFAWDYLETGPRTWRAGLTRLAPPPLDSGVADSVAAHEDLAEFTGPRFFNDSLA